jgi:Uma2 family endonuclease
VEVVSKNDTDYEIEERVIQYQQSNVGLVWIIHPVSQTVAVYRLESGVRAQILYGEDELSGEKVLPGFSLTVKNIFE